MHKLGDVKLAIGNSSMTLQELPTSFTLKLPPHTTLDDQVTEYRAVVSQQEELVTQGDFARISSHGTEVRYKSYVCIPQSTHA